MINLYQVWKNNISVSIRFLSDHWFEKCCRSYMSKLFIVVKKFQHKSSHSLIDLYSGLEKKTSLILYQEVTIVKIDTIPIVINGSLFIKLLPKFGQETAIDQIQSKLKKTNSICNFIVGTVSKPHDQINSQSLTGVQVIRLVVVTYSPSTL